MKFIQRQHYSHRPAKAVTAFLVGAIFSGCTASVPEKEHPTDEPVYSLSIAEAQSTDNTFTVKSDGTSVDVDFTLQLSEILAEDAEISFECSEEEVATYNSTNNTSYAILPSDRYSFKATGGTTDTGVLLPAGNTSTKVTLNIEWSDPETGKSSYLLPIAIASATSGDSKFEISRKPYYVIVEFDIPKSSFKHPTSGRIPVLRISTGASSYDANRIKKDTYIDATITIEDPDKLYSQEASESIETEIKGRGNTTWDLPKRPYRLKLSAKKELLGMPDNKHFVLLANYNDKTLLRNSVAFRLSELAGMMWSPRWVPVELYVDNSFRGQYMLTEQVRVDKERINVDVVGPDEVDGGYSFEIDYKEQDDGTPGWLQLPQNQIGQNRMYFAFDDPEAPTAEQLAWAKNYVARVQTAIDKATTLPTGYADALSELIDVSSFIQYFFVQEITKNVDGNLRLSSPIAIARGGTLFFPCVWDFDLALGGASYHGSEVSGADGTAKGWYVRTSQWLGTMFKNDEFCARVKAEWEELYPKLAGVNDDVRAWAALLDDAQRRNFTSSLWGTANYTDEVDNMLKFYNDRVDWMNTEIRAGRHKNTGN